MPNSTGNPARITAVGDNAVERGDLRLVAGSMPAHSFGLFLTSFDIGPPVTPGGALRSYSA
ncbi:MAG: hypothetical protein R3F49_11260 [Planctomycetota bacterium]